MTRAICGCHLRPQDGANGSTPCWRRSRTTGPTARRGRTMPSGLAAGARRRRTSERTAGPRFDPAAGLALRQRTRASTTRESLCDALGVPRPDRPTSPTTSSFLRAYARWGRECPATCLGTTRSPYGTRSGACCSAPATTPGPGPSTTPRRPRGLVFASAVEAVLRGARRLQRTGRSHRGGALDAHRGEHDDAHVLQGGPQAAAPAMR